MRNAKVIDGARVRRSGWSLGTTCPFSCRHCYTAASRQKSGELTVEHINAVIGTFVALGVESVVLGGNEPIYAGGADPRSSLLPFIISELLAEGIKPILITSGLSARFLEMYSPDLFPLLAAVVLSLDSPVEDDHNASRGAPLFQIAQRARDTCHEAGVPTLICVTPMKANFTVDTLSGFVNLAEDWGSLLRMNTYMSSGGLADPQAVTLDQYWAGYRFLVENCTTMLVDEPPLFPWFGREAGPNCGSSSIRVGFPTKDGDIPVTPCQYRPEFASIGYGGPLPPSQRSKQAVH